jgi:hypothetical protein
MAKLDKELVDKIELLREETIACYTNGDSEGAINAITKAWGMLPNPKTIYDESFMIVELIVDLFIRTKNFVKANEWIDLIFICNLERIDGGDREFIAGKLAYEQGNLGKAKEMFFVANLKSKGRIFGSKDPKYVKLIK